jgi:hypothetical protein
MWRRADLVWTAVSEEHIASIFRVEKSASCRLHPPAYAGSSLADFSALKMDAICSSETSVHTRSARRHIPEDGILHSHRRGNLKSYIVFFWLRILEYVQHWAENNYLESNLPVNSTAFVKGPPCTYWNWKSDEGIICVPWWWPLEWIETRSGV